MACDRCVVSVTFSVASQVIQRAFQLNVYNYPIAAYYVVGLAEGLNSFGGRGVCAWLLLTAVWWSALSVRRAFVFQVSHITGFSTAVR